jgi:hypothetical protein
MTGTYTGVRIIGALAALLQVSLLLSCSNGSLVTGETAQANSGMTQKSGSAPDNEGDAADLPSEISGAFLTCSFVTTEDTSFPPRDDHHSVGCGLRDSSGEKVDLSRFETSLTQLDAAQKELPTQTKMAPSGSPWHLHTQIALNTPRDHRLAFSVRQARTDQKIKTYQFEIIGLYGASLSSGTVVEVVDKLSVGGTWSKTANLNLAGTQPIRSTANTPVIASTFCADGVVRKKFDQSCVSPLGQILSNIGQEINYFNMAIDTKNKTTKKSAACFTQISETKCGTTFGLEIVGTSPVLEGAGCLLIMSPDAMLIYGKSQIETYHLNAGLLAQYVKAKACGS